MIILLAVLCSGMWAGCWKVSELGDIGEFELDGVVALSFKDGVSCETVSNASVYLEGELFAKTDSLGYVYIPVEQLEGKFSGTLRLVVKKIGHIEYEGVLKVQAETIVNQTYLLSKEMPISSMRFVLSWNAKPRNLDLHLFSDTYHVSYHNKSQS